jgi:DNA polymerase I
MQADICGVSLALKDNEACYVPLNHKQVGDGTGLFAGGLAPDQIGLDDALGLLKPILEDPAVLKVGHNLKVDLLVLAQHGIDTRSIEDIMLMAYVLDAGRTSHDLESLAESMLGHTLVTQDAVTGTGKNRLAFDVVTIEKAADYAAGNADATRRIWRVLKQRLIAERVNTVYETLERPLVRPLMRMERRGISVDRQTLSRLSGDFAQSAARLEADIQEMAGEPINPGSPKQLGDIMFGKMGLPGGAKTKTGAWSTSAQILDELAEAGHDFPKKILEWRQVTKLKSTYTDSLPGFINPTTNRVHTSYALAATTTGRLSSNDPNLQRPATSWCRPTTRRSSCGCSRKSPTSRR